MINRKLDINMLSASQRLLAVLFLIFVFPLILNAQIAELIHTPVPSVSEGTRVPIKAEMLDGTAREDIDEAYIWYRAAGEDNYKSVPFDFANGAFSGTIPGSATRVAAIEYYLFVRLTTGEQVTFPKFDPQDNPLTVNINQVVRSTETIVDDDILILAPEIGEVLREDAVTIALSYSPRTIGRNREALVLMIDGKDRTNKARFSERTMIVNISGLGKGIHRIELLQRIDGTVKTLAGWNFEIRLPYGDDAPTFSDIAGNIGVEGIFERRLGTERDIENVFGGLSGRFVEWDFVAQGRFTSEESGRLQPQNRYSISFSNEKGYLKAGDVYPAYNELVLWGRHIRGFDYLRRWDRWSFQTAYGQLNRAVEGRITSIDTTFDISGAEPVVASIDTAFNTGTFKRSLWSMRIGFDNQRNMKGGFTLMKARDDRNSVDNGLRPKDNLVSGLDFKYIMDQKRTQLEVLAAVSSYNDDISEGTYTGYGWFRDILWVNLNSDPVPSDTSGNFTRVLGDVLSKSLSIRAKARMRYYDHDMQLGWKLYNHSYNSIANPSLINDRHGFFATDRFPIAKGKVFANVGTDIYWDNVRNEADIRNTFTEVYAGLSFYTAPHLPNFSLSFRNRSNTNDASVRYEINEVGGVADTTIIDSRKEQSTNSINANISHRLALLGASHDLNLNVISFIRSDTYNSFGEQDQLNFALNLRTLYDSPLTSNLAISQATGTSAGGNNELTFNNASLRLDYDLSQYKLTPYLAPRLTIGSGTNAVSMFSPTELMEISGLDPDDPAVAAQIDTLNLTTAKNQLIDFTRIDWIAGLEYRLTQNHVFTLYAMMTSFTDNGQFEYYNGAKFGTDEERVTNTDGTITVSFDQSASKIKRDDVLAMLKYTYHF